MTAGGMVPQGGSEDPFMNAAPTIGFGGQQQPESDLTQEELELIAKVEEDSQERKRALFLKQEAEQDQKRARKANAEETLAQIKNDKQKQIEQRRRGNAESEQAFFATRDEQRKGNNPWERVNENCDFS